jgi:flagellar hook-associated protein 1
MPNILNIGQTGLNAAQLGLATTGHNIANAATPGYSRQLVIQSTPLAQNVGVAFVGNGTSVTEIKRAYNDYLSNQVVTAQTSQGQLGTFYSQIQQIDNMFADPTSGLSPTLQNFFSTIQNVAANPTSGASRQTMLASANTLASQFQSMDGQLSDIRQGVNEQITSTIGTINAYATQIAALNDAISKAQLGSDLKPANDLLDQRDQVLSDLSKQVQVSVVKQGDNYNVFIGNGQPLVVSNQSFTLAPIASTTDISRLEVGYQQSNGTVVALPESSITGGALGGLFDFRTQSLDQAQNALGRMAIGLATTFNAQHELGQDQNGALGGAFFNVGTPVVTPSTLNTGSAVVSATISNVSALTTSNYDLQITTAAIPAAPAVPTTPGVYKLTRLSDGSVTTFSAFPQTVDGVDFNIASGSIANGDEFLIKPTIAGASSLSVAITDTAKIAVAAPIRTAATLANSGSGQISAGAVDSSYTASAVTPAVTLTYNSGTNKLSGFPASMAVTVTNNGTSTVFAAGTPVTYTDGATISFGGVSFTLSGVPANGDTYTIGPNSNGAGDNRNALLLGALQNTNTLVNGTTSYQGAYGLLVNSIGNKTRELEVTSSAADKLVTNAVASQQAVSGVNLDEEATNLMKYQQAYQACGKVMQTASKMFDVLLSLGG